MTYLGRWKKAPGAQDDEGERDERGSSWPARRRPEPQIEPRHRRDDHRGQAVCDQQRAKAIAMGRSQHQHPRERPHDAEHDRPVETFFGGQLRATRTVEPRNPEENGARQPGDHEEGGKDEHAAEEYRTLVTRGRRR